MAVVKVVMLCVAAALMCAAIRVERPEMAMALSIAAGVIAVLWSLEYIKDAVNGALALAEGLDMGNGSVQILLRAAGVSLIGEFAEQLCRDAGETALAGRVQLCVRAALFSLSVPLISGLVTRLCAFLPQ